MLQLIWQQLQLPCTEQPSLELHSGYRGRSPRAGRRPGRVNRTWFLARQLDWITEKARKLFETARRLQLLWEIRAEEALIAKPERDQARRVPASERRRYHLQVIARWHVYRAARRLAWRRYRRALLAFESWNRQ